MSLMNQTVGNGIGSHKKKSSYRELFEEIPSEDASSYNEDLISRTTTVVEKADSLLEEGTVEERAKHPGEIFLDSKVLRSASRVAMRITASFSGNVNIYDKNKLAQHIRENPNFWCFALPREVPTVTFIYGTIPEPVESRPRAPRKAVQKQQAHALKAPKIVDRMQTTEEDMVGKIKKFITKIYMRTGEPLSYFHTVLNPNSFSATIENIYHVSFLVRENFLELYLDDTFGLPHISPILDSSSQYSRDVGDEKQFIVSMNRKRWQELINAFGIKKPMMVLRK